MTDVREMPRVQTYRGVPRARDVAALTEVQGFPCISVLLPTQPASMMTTNDRQSLKALVRTVADILEDHHVTARPHLMHRLEEMATLAARQPTDRGLALLLSSASSHTFVLPVAPAARAVVEPTFATRDLVRAMHATPPHMVLLVHGTCAHLYRTTGRSVMSVAAVDALGGAGNSWLPASDRADQPERTESFLRRVDEMLKWHRDEHPSPLILAGPPALLERLRATSRNLHRLAGTIEPPAIDDHVQLFAAAATQLDRYLAARRDDALNTLRDAVRTRPGDVTSGIEGCWAAIRQIHPGFLLVEEGYVSPGNVGGPGVGQRQDGSYPVHDLVDDLIERVIRRGGLLAFVEDGDLAEHGRVALVARRP